MPAKVEPEELNPPYKFVEVVWLDAQSDSAWLTAKDLPRAVPVVSRGWLVDETINECVLCASWIAPTKPGEDEQLGDCVAVPMGMVIEGPTEL